MVNAPIVMMKTFLATDVAEMDRLCNDYKIVNRKYKFVATTITSVVFGNDIVWSATLFYEVWDI